MTGQQIIDGGGGNTDANKKPLEPGKTYQVQMLEPVDHTRMVKSAFKTGGMEEVRKYTSKIRDLKRQYDQQQKAKEEKKLPSKHGRQEDSKPPSD